MFQKYHVDIYMSGHVHGYERMWPLCSGVVSSKSYVNATCPIHIVNGAAGNIEGHSGYGPATDYLAYKNGNDYGFGILDVQTTTLRWSFYRSLDNQLDDSVEITK